MNGAKQNEEFTLSFSGFFAFAQNDNITQSIFYLTFILYLSETFPLISWWNFNIVSEIITSLFFVGLIRIFRRISALCRCFTNRSKRFPSREFHMNSSMFFILVFHSNGLIQSEIVCFSGKLGRIHFIRLFFIQLSHFRHAHFRRAHSYSWWTGRPDASGRRSFWLHGAPCRQATGRRKRWPSPLLPSAARARRS